MKEELWRNKSVLAGDAICLLISQYWGGFGDSSFIHYKEKNAESVLWTFHHSTLCSEVFLDSLEERKMFYIYIYISLTRLLGPASRHMPLTGPDIRAWRGENIEFWYLVIAGGYSNWAERSEFLWLVYSIETNVIKA